MYLKNKAIISFLPLSLLLIPVFAGGIVFTLLQSFNQFLPYSYPGIFSSYKAVLCDPWFYRTFFFSVYIGAVSASASVLLGLLTASLFWCLPLKWQKAGTLYKVLLVMPHLSIAYFVMLFFSKTGIVSSFLFNTGMIENYEQFPVLVFDSYGIGIILSYILKGTPFAVLMVSALLKNLDKGFLDTAGMLGAGKVRIFLEIIVPSVKPAAEASFLILFLYSFGAFDIPFLIGSSRPDMVSVSVYSLYFRRDLVNRPQAMAVLSIMLLFSIFFIYLYSVISARLDERVKIL